VPSTPLTTTPPPPPDPNAAPSDEIQRLIDLYSSTYGNSQQPGVESLLNPMFARQRQNAIGDINAAGAALGSDVISSGGFGANRNQAVSDLSGQQSAALAGELSKEYLAKMDQQTKFAGFATEAGMQKYVTDINAQLSRDNVQTNADLARWLATEDNALKKYGIDVNDVLQRYQADLQLKGIQYSADASVSAASIHAAATQAAASAAAGAGMYGADLNYKLGLAGLGVDREKNIGSFMIDLFKLGLGGLSGMSDIFSNFPFGSVVVKP
jgi:hypothetical protein